MGPETLDGLLSRFESSLRWVEEEPARPALRGDWPGGLSPRVVDAAAQVGIDQPWRHQAAAMAALMAGEHVVQVGPTASGKTLGYMAPALSALLADPGARVLYLAPTKALAQDQRQVLTRWSEALPTAHRFAADTYDGDTPRAQRGAIRRRVRWLLTNPEMLHQGILPNHAQWATFLQGLRLVVLDELHVYRGVFGSHVANLLRRLRRLVRFHGGGAPQVAACSATIANPESLLRQLLGEGDRRDDRPGAGDRPGADDRPDDCRITVIPGDDAPRAARRFACIVPPLVNPILSIRRRLSDEVEDVALALLEAGVRSVVFVRTRRAVEELVRRLRSAGTVIDGLQPREAIRSYRAGLRPVERRAIEAGLRQGTVRLVVATSALELGVDVGPLQAAVLAGYPGDLSSLRQQAGRVGRRDQRALVVLVAGNSALERYLIRRPELLLSGRPEHAQVDPDNPLILRDHLRCAAFELPLGQAEGEAHTDALDALVEAGELRRAETRTYWVGREPPAPRVGLRSMEVNPIRLERAPVDDGRRRRQVSLVGTLERSVALGVAYPGALYVHDGDVYRVTDVSWEEGRAVLRPSDSKHVTAASQEHELFLLDATGERRVAGGVVRHGPTELRVRTTGYRELDPGSGAMLTEADLELPEVCRTAEAYWLTLSPDTVNALRRGGWWRPDPVGYRGPDWQAQRRRARERDGYQCVHCGVVEQEREHDIHHLRPFREFGYVRGENLAYREANRLDNLVTLCRVCHARAENGQRFQGALERLAYLFGNLAPLVLMCDPRDLELRVHRDPPGEGESGHINTPSLVIAERTPSGVGYAAALYDLHEELVSHAHRLVARCGCPAGCPACVGPPDVRGDGDGASNARAFAQEILRALGAVPDEATG